MSGTSSRLRESSRIRRRSRRCSPTRSGSSSGRSIAVTSIPWATAPGGRLSGWEPRLRRYRPAYGWGRVVGSLVIVIGVTFISFLTVKLTSFLVSARQEMQNGKSQMTCEASGEETHPLLREVLERLGVIEKRVAHLPTAEPRR